MKKSRLDHLFSEEPSSSDKTLLTYQPASQPGLGRTAADSPSPETSSSTLPSTTHHTADGEPPVLEPPRESCPDTSPPGNTSVASAGGDPELLHSCVVSAFTFSGSQSVSLGPLGCALYWEPSQGRSLLVLYRSRQQQLCLLSLTPGSLPAVQPRCYVSFQCDAGRRFSIHLASPAALREFAVKTVLAVTLASAGAGGQSPAGLLLPAEDESVSPGGRQARSGDRLQLELTEWAVQKSRSESLQQQGGLRSDAGTLDGWRSALRGARPGQRWLVGDPAAVDIVREVLVVAVTPPPRQPPLQLPTDDGSDWRPEDEEASLSPGPSPSPSPSPLPADAGRLGHDAEGRVKGESEVRDAPDEDGDMPPSGGRSDVLARMARLGQQMFPSPVGPGRGQTPPPPDSPTRQPSALTHTGDATSAKAVVTAGDPDTTAGGALASSGRKPAVSSHKPPTRPPPAPRPAVSLQTNSTELGVLFGRLEAKVETLLSRIDLSMDADPESLTAGVRRLAAENAALREASRKAERAAEQRVAAERCRATLADELADALAELAEVKRELGQTRRRLADVESTAAAATRREREFETQLAAAKSAATSPADSARTAPEAAEAAGATRECRRALKAVYKGLRSRLPAGGTFTGAEVAEMTAELVTETLQRIETVAESTANGDRGQPPLVTQDQCAEQGDE